MSEVQVPQKIRREIPKLPLSEDHLALYQQQGYYVLDKSPQARVEMPEGSLLEFLGAATESVGKERLSAIRSLVYDPTRIRSLPITLRGRNQDQDRETITRALLNSGEGFKKIETFDKSLLAFVAPIEAPTPESAS